MTRKSLWQVSRRALLWAGLALCSYTLWRAHEASGIAISQLSLSGWIATGILLVAIWILAVASWREYLRAYQLNDTRWRTACRHLGLLLVGKYIPGGIFGFLMRIYDQPKDERRKLLWASLADQCTGVAMPILLGTCLLMIENRHNWLWALLLIPLPLAAVTGISLLHRFTAYLPLISRHLPPLGAPPTATLHFATTIQLCQIIAWASLVMALAQQLYNLDTLAALGVAGAYLLAVATGMLVVFLPSGIGAREAALVTLASQWLELSQAVYLAALLRILSSMLDILAGAISAAIDSREKNSEPT